MNCKRYYIKDMLDDIMDMGLVIGIILDTQMAGHVWNLKASVYRDFAC